jgi:hypothetical protein
MLATGTALYIALLCHPDPLFAYNLREGAIVLHSPRPLPLRAREIARDADARVARSPLYDRSVTHHVYLCDTSACFVFFSNYRYRVGGVAYGGLNGSVFVRPSHIERDRLIGPSGREVQGERTLTYFIAHEVVHAILCQSLGRVRYQQLATWQNEGYADYIAKAGAFDYAQEARRYRDGAPELDPAQSGLYLRYHLFVSYWLDQRGLSVRQLFSLPPDAPHID